MLCACVLESYIIDSVVSLYFGVCFSNMSTVGGVDGGRHGDGGADALCVCVCRVVKEEISDDDARLPFVNGRVVCWVRDTHIYSLTHSLMHTRTSTVVFPFIQLVSAETCQPDFSGSDLQSVATPTSLAPPPIERTGGIGHSRPPSFQ